MFKATPIDGIAPTLTKYQFVTLCPGISRASCTPWLARLTAALPDVRQRRWSLLFGDQVMYINLHKIEI